MDDLYQLSYVSQRARQLLDDDIVDGIVLPSMAKNRMLDVTGCLWFDTECFVQVLEGAQRTIEDLYEVIRQDTRHTNVILLHDCPIGERAFLRFRMRSVQGRAVGTIHELKVLRGTASADFSTLASRIVVELAALPESG